MYKKETKEVVEQKKIIVAVVCDNCGREYRCNEMPQDWHTILSYHNEWGNDSGDSHEGHQVCSLNCYKEKLTEVVNDLEGCNSAKIDGMTLEFAKKIVSFFVRYDNIIAEIEPRECNHTNRVEVTTNFKDTLITYACLDCGKTFHTSL